MNPSKVFEECALDAYFKVLDAMTSTFVRIKPTVTTLQTAYAEALKVEQQFNPHNGLNLNIGTQRAFQNSNAYSSNFNSQSIPNFLMSANSIHSNSLQQWYYPNSMATNFNPSVNSAMPQANSFVNNQQQMIPFVNNSLVNVAPLPQPNPTVYHPLYLIHHYNMLLLHLF